MWKIALSAVLTVFTLAWVAVVARQAVKKLDKVFGNDDTWPPGAVTA